MTAMRTSAQAGAAVDAARLLNRLHAAIARGDSQAVHSMLSDDLRWVVGSGGASVSTAQLVRAVAAPSPVRFTIDSVHAQRYGDMLVADYVRHDRWPLGDSSFTTSWRAMAVFARAHAHWQLVRHTLTWLAQPVRGIAEDSSALDAYVGRYQLATGYVDNVHWENGHLVATATRETRGAQLIRVSESGFSPDGIGAVLVFERDPSGRVVDYVQAYPDGRVVRARRLP